ncbi:MAG: ParA family protein [Oleiphilaceae bacterium]|nr:ParA family protein [Oleiphilaceae bacterium]
MNVLALYNLKGGVGKTTAAVNLASEAARDGHRVLLWDLDAQAAASWYLQHDQGLQKSSKKMLLGKQPLGREIVGTPVPGLDLLPADARHRHLDVLLAQKTDDRHHLKRLLAPLSEAYSLVILDCPPTFSRLSDNLFEAADIIAVPTVPTPLSLRAWEQLTAHLDRQKRPRKKLRPFLSLVDRRRPLHRQWCDTPPLILSRLAKAVIPYTSDCERMGEFRRPVAEFAPRGRATLAFRQLWRELSDALNKPGSSRKKAR